MNALAKRNRNVGSMLSSRSPWGAFDELFSDVGFPFSRALNTYSPVTYENDNEYICEFDMPGLDKKDIDISIEKGHLLIKGHKESGSRVRSYSETIRIGDGVIEEDIKAEYVNGVLALKIPKAKKKDKKAKTITVT